MESSLINLYIYITTQPAWDVFEMSQTDLHWERHLKDLSETSQKRCLFCDAFITPQIHLKKDVFFVTSLRRFKYISKKMSFLWRLYHASNTSHKRCFSGDVIRTSQTCLKKDVYSLTSLICLKNISWKYLWLFKNITQKWFRADKVGVWALKTLKKMKHCFLRAMHSH